MQKALIRKKADKVESIVDQISSAPVKCKFYEHIHSYCKVFLKNYNLPQALTLMEIKQIKLLFKDIEFAYTTLYHLDNVFFSYPWLLYTILEAMGKVEYLMFIKNLKCKKRSAIYREKLIKCLEYLVRMNKGLSPLCSVVYKFLTEEQPVLEEEAVLSRVCGRVDTCVLV